MRPLICFSKNWTETERSNTQVKNKLVSALWWTNCKSVLTCLFMGYNYMWYIIHLWLSQITQIIIIISQLFICVSFSDRFIGRICSGSKGWTCAKTKRKKSRKMKQQINTFSVLQLIIILGLSQVQFGTPVVQASLRPMILKSFPAKLIFKILI